MDNIIACSCSYHDSEEMTSHAPLCRYGKLFIGNSSDARNLDAIKANNISAILNVAEDLNINIQYPDGVRLYRVGMSDGMNNPRDLFYAAVLTLRGLLEKGYTVLVHCHQGRSRSPSVVAAMLAIEEGKTFSEKLSEIKKARSLVNPEPGMIDYAELCFPWLISHLALSRT